MTKVLDLKSRDRTVVGLVKTLQLILFEIRADKCRLGVCCCNAGDLLPTAATSVLSKPAVS
jgi:hypothetical protein